MIFAKFYKSQEYKYFSLWGVVCFLLLLSGFILGYRIQALKKKNAQNLAKLNQVLPGFNNQSLAKLKDEVGGLKISLGKLSSLTDNKERWMIKDYDLSIYFVEELNKTNQYLKMKADNKQVNYPALGFQEQLPSESDAIYLLSQLNGLKKAVDLGIDYGINFSSLSPQLVNPQPVNPQPVKPQETEKEVKEEPAGMMPINSRIEFSSTAQALIEFIIQLNEINPKVFFETISLKAGDSNFKMALVFSQVVMDTNWDLAGECSPEDIESVMPEENFADMLRINNPFLMPPAKDASLSNQLGATGQAQEPKQAVRFFYRGRAALKSKTVAVIEDSLNQETFFLEREERIGNFVLKDFSDKEAILKNIDNGEELTIKRE